MSCCAADIVTFVNVSQTVIGYDGRYGAVPRVDVAYVSEDGFNLPVSLGQVSIGEGIITVDHGGPSTGVIKIS